MAAHPDHLQGLRDLALGRMLSMMALRDRNQWGRQSTHRPINSPSSAVYSSRESMAASAFALCFQVSTWGAPTTSISRFALAVMLPANFTRLDTRLTSGKYFFLRS